jgi:hypothetical protein
MDAALIFPNPVPSPTPPTIPEVHVQAPVVYVAPVWEYKHIARDLASEELLGDAELNELGTQGWELTSVVTDGRSAHFYFKRLTN